MLNLKNAAFLCLFTSFNLTLAMPPCLSKGGHHGGGHHGASHHEAGQHKGERHGGGEHHASSRHKVGHTGSNRLRGYGYSGVNTYTDTVTTRRQPGMIYQNKNSSGGVVTDYIYKDKPAQ